MAKGDLIVFEVLRDDCELDVDDGRVASIRCHRVVSPDELVAPPRLRGNTEALERPNEYRVVKKRGRKGELGLDENGYACPIVNDDLENETSVVIVETIYEAKP